MVQFPIRRMLKENYVLTFYEEAFIEVRQENVSSNDLVRVTEPPCLRQAFCPRV
jgi:hypothetical protein